MDTVALVQPNACCRQAIAASAAALIAILHAKGRPIVARGHNATVLDDDAADGPLHAVRALRD